MIDSICKLLGLKQVSDFNDVAGTQLCPVFQIQQEPFLVKLDFSLKLEDIGKQFTEHGFEQGDTVLLVRAFELNS
jgi:hypothetical protein